MSIQNIMSVNAISDQITSDKVVIGQGILLYYYYSLSFITILYGLFTIVIHIVVCRISFVVNWSLRLSFFAKLVFEIAIDQQARTGDRTFEGVPDPNRQTVPAGQPCPFLVQIRPNLDKCQIIVMCDLCINNHYITV